MRQIVLDTETTGLEVERDHRIIEIGAVELVNRRATGRSFHRYLNPDRAIDEGARAVHGIASADLANAPRFADIAAELLGFLAGAELVIHNAAFDVGFVNAELARLRRGGIAEVVSGIVDSLAMARELYPGKSNSLDALCRRLEVDNSNRSLHGALLDAGLLAQVYIRMTRGQDSLVMDAHEASSMLVHADSVDLAAFELPVLVADEGELEAHEALLDQLDKSSGGATLWRSAATLS